MVYAGEEAFMWDCISPEKYRKIEMEEIDDMLHAIVYTWYS
jgi:hypothetical protein